MPAAERVAEYFGSSCNRLIDQSGTGCCRRSYRHSDMVRPAKQIVQSWGGMLERAGELAQQLRRWIIQILRVGYRMTWIRRTNRRSPTGRDSPHITLPAMGP